MKQLEDMGFKYDNDPDWKWTAPAGATWGGMLLALLKIREWSKERHDISRQGALDEVLACVGAAIEGTERADGRQHFETLLKVNELTRRAEGSSMKFVV